MLKLDKICKTCKKHYDIDVSKDPIWMFDCCSIKCSDDYFHKTGSGLLPRDVVLPEFIEKNMVKYG